jgi:hypothetical protein
MPATTRSSRIISTIVSAQAPRAAARAVLEVPGVIASYKLNGGQNDYELEDTNPMSRSERRWFDSHAEELVDTMAAANGPDVVGLVPTDVTYGLVFYGPGVSPQLRGRRGGAARALAELE